MRDVDRDSITRFVYSKLTDADFRGRLRALAPDGSRPLTIALRSDQVRLVLDDVLAKGGASNVVVPALNGIVVAAMQLDGGAPHQVDLRSALVADCTMGVLLARMSFDPGSGGSATYMFMYPRADAQQGSGQAEVVALAG